jgi:hypothetical protein
MKTTITQVGAGGAGEASRIAVQAIDAGRAITAVRNGSGDLLLIGWDTTGRKIERLGASEHLAGEAHEIALTLLRNRNQVRAVTSVRAGDGRLLLISWDVSSDARTIRRLHDSETLAGEARLIEATATIDASTLLTAVRAGNGTLKLISWRLRPDGTFARLGDSGDQAGEVGAIAVAALGNQSRTVVTAVRAGNGRIKLIGWNVPAEGRIERFPRDREFEGAAVGEIAMVARRDVADEIFPRPGVVTAARNGSGNLVVTLWDVSANGFGIAGEHVGGTARALAVAQAGPSSSDYVVSMRNGSDVLQLIALRVGRNGGLTRTDDHVRQGTKVTETAIVGLSDGRALSATRAGNFLSLETWSITEELRSSPGLDESQPVTG